MIYVVVYLKYPKVHGIEIISVIIWSLTQNRQYYRNKPIILKHLKYIAKQKLL